MSPYSRVTPAARRRLSTLPAPILKPNGGCSCRSVQRSIFRRGAISKLGRAEKYRRFDREFCIPTTGTKVPSGPLQTSPTKQNIRRANSGKNNEGPRCDSYLAGFERRRRSGVQDLLNGRRLHKGVP